ADAAVLLPLCPLLLTLAACAEVVPCTQSPRVTSGREPSPAPTASTQAGGSPTPWPGGTDAGLLSAGSPPAGPGPPPLARPSLGPGAAARLPAAAKRRRPRPRVPASVLPW